MTPMLIHAVLAVYIMVSHGENVAHYANDCQLTNDIFDVVCKKGPYCVIRYASGCRWANDGCETDEQCCSGRCFLAHPGTNPRCRTTGMGGPCLFSFHCDEGMQCGDGHRCCAGNWGTCSKDQDCCNEFLKCKTIRGFVYKKCRMKTNAYLPKAGAAHRRTSITHTAAAAIICILSTWR